MEPVVEKLLVVVDPFDLKHSALERAVITAGIRDAKIHINLFIIAHSDFSESDKKTFNNIALDELTEPLRENNIPYSYEFSWSREIEEAIVLAAGNYNADLIIDTLGEYVLKRHKGLTRGAWRLLRNSDCPVMLVKPGSSGKRKNILAAVNFQSPFPEYTELNKKILKRASWLAEKYEAELSVVNGYESMMDYPDHNKIMQESGVAHKDIYLEEGRPENAVARVAEKIGADLVVIGTRNTHDVESKFRRNTAEKVLMKLNTDVIVLN